LRQGEAVQARQFDVGNEGVRAVACIPRQRLFRRSYAQNVAAPALQKLLIAFSCVVFVLDNQDAVFSLQSFDGAHRRPSFIAHAAQPLPGSLVMNGSLRFFLDTSTLTSRPPLAKFLASLLKKLQKSHLWES